MKHIVLNIEGMTCSACSNGLEKYLNRQEGVEATVNLVMATAAVDYDETKVSVEDLNKYVREAGFKSGGERSKTGNTKTAFYLIIAFAVLSAFLMYIGMGDMAGLPIPSFLNKMNSPVTYVILLIASSLAALVWGFDIVKNGIKNLIHGMPNMDSLICVGVIVTFIYSSYNAYFVFAGEGDLTKLFYESIVMIILFVKIGRYIDKKNKAKAVDTIKNLVTLTPKKAVVLRDGREETVTLNEIEKGDILACRPGEKIAVDGKIIKGETHTDESFITGESKPVSKKPGDTCLAGSINYDGYVEYEAVNIGRDSSISQIVDLVVNATNTKAPIARIADKISGVFVPFIFLAAVISFVINMIVTSQVSQSLEAMVSVLVVACPCALGLATPLVMVVAIGTASRKGLVIKSSEIIEQLNRIDTIVFDKTGTLTKGELEIADKALKEGEDEDKLLKLLQSLETKSNHPLAKSICKNAENLFEVSDFSETSGKGVAGIIDGKKYYAGNKKYFDDFDLKNCFLQSAEEFSAKGESLVYFWNDDGLLALFGLRDEIKDGIRETIENLEAMGKRTVMLSGDNENTAKIIAKELGIREVYSNISPQGKVEKIQELNEFKCVLMVGDGINDSPALKTAEIGISVSNGTDISNDAADVIMMSDDMNKICELFKIGRKAITAIKQNLFWALFYNVCMIPLATGLLPIGINPMVASLAMVISSITVVLNSLRLKKV